MPFEITTRACFLNLYRQLLPTYRAYQRLAFYFVTLCLYDFLLFICQVYLQFIIIIYMALF